MRITSILLTGALMMAATSPLHYPEARRGDTVDVIFGTKVADPYRWMEDVDSPEVKTWVDAENALTQGFLAGVPAREKIHARLMELNNFERVSAPGRQGGRYFFTRNTGLQNQAVLYWQQGPDGSPKVLLDPNTLAADGTVALQSTAVSEDGTLVAYALAEAGSDVEKVHIKNVATGADLPDLVEWVKFSGISWMKDGSGFFYSSFGVPKTDAERAEALKRANFNHKVYFHKLGTPQTADFVVFARPDDKEVLVNGGVSEDGHWLILSQGKGHTNALAIRDLTKPGWQAPDAPVIKIAPVDDAIYYWVTGTGREAWVFTDKAAPKGKVMKVDLDHPEQANWKPVYRRDRQLARRR